MGCDLLGSLVAVLAFAAVLFTPGYLLAYVTDLFGFRARSFTEQSSWAIASSLLVSPISAHLVGRVGGLRSLCWVYCGTALVTVALLLKDRPAWPARDRRLITLVACGWIVFVLLMLIDFQEGRKLYFSVVMADESYRIAFTDAVLRTGIPPSNPLFFAKTAAPMRYYYFWYVLCATVAKLAHVSSRQAFIASSAWAGFGLLATIRLYTQHFFHWQRKQRWLAVGLLLVTGADLLPALGQAILQPALNGDTEWWSVDPIDSWPDSLLWVPHHVASALCCLLAFLLLWRTRESLTRSTRRIALILAGLGFASASGLSVYVASGFALILLAWVIRLFVLRDAEALILTRRLVAGGIVSAVALTPFFRELASGLVHSAESTPGPGSPVAPHLLVLSVRRFIDSGLLTDLPAFTHWNQTHPILLDQVLRVLLLIPGLGMELGLFGVVLVLLLVARRRGQLARDPARDDALFFTVAGLLLTLFVSSSVITNNDFGYRAVMLPQFFLLLLTADYLASCRFSGAPAPVAPTSACPKLLGALLVLGVAGTAYWAFLLRVWLPLETRAVQNGFTPLPEDEYQIREAFETLDSLAPQAAVVAFRPIDPTPDRGNAVMVPNEFYQRMLVMDTGRQMLNAEGKCAVHFGGNPIPCREIQQATARLYATPAPSAEQARLFCTRFGVSFLSLSVWDPQWHAASGWPLELPTLVSEPRLRILRCN